jgi:hypothetical protein
LVIAGLDALKQPLRNLHRPLGGESELAAGFLRQRRCGKWGRGTLDTGLLFDRGDRPRHVPANGLNERGRLFLAEQPRVLVLQCTGLGIEVLAGRDALVAETDERGDELAAFALDSLPGPSNRRVKCSSLFFALDDQPDGNVGTRPALSPSAPFP